MDKNDTMDFVAHARMLPKQRNAFAGARARRVSGNVRKAEASNLSWRF